MFTGLFLRKHVGDTVISNPVEPGCQIFNPPDVPEADSKLVEDILQNILSLYTIGNSVPYIAEQTFPLVFINSSYFI